MAATYEPIASTTLGSASSSVTLSSIPSGYTDLILGYWLSESTGNVRGMIVRFNSDTGSNYSGTYLHGNGSSASSGRLSSQTGAYVGRYLNINGRAIGRLHIQNYANTSVYKTVLGEAANAEDSYNPGTAREVHLWRSTSAITSVTFVAGSPAAFATGSSFSLYGIKAA